MNIGKIACVSPLLFLASCASVNQDNMQYAPDYPVNKVRASKDCYDASIILNKSLLETKKIVLDVTKNLDAQTIKDTEEQYIIKRKHHIGLVVGSGGETISFTFKKLKDNKTFITIDTKRDFVGIAGQKAWSCDIANHLMNKIK